MKKNFKVVAKWNGKSETVYFESFNEMREQINNGGLTIWNCETIEVYIKNKEDGRKWEQFQKFEMTRNW